MAGERRIGVADRGRLVDRHGLYDDDAGELAHLLPLQVVGRRRGGRRPPLGATPAARRGAAPRVRLPRRRTEVRVPPARVFVGAPRPHHWLVLALLRLSFAADTVRLRRLGVRL